MRVLKWIVDRCEEKAGAQESPLGWMPRQDDLEWSGLEFPTERFTELMRLNKDGWTRELALHDELFTKLSERLPQEFALKRESLLSSLKHATQFWT
jgi:phosphoenolpyruvate carboxykinase (GTP)